jgi:spermidine/putrescine ABC transporter ATP-binding subunit
MIDVRLKDVVVWYGDFKALQGISLEIEAGEFVALLGPSGCGKTTTLRTIAGFVRTNEGEIYIKGKLVNSIPAYKRDIGMVFQNFALFPHMTIEENIAFGLKMMKRPKAEIAERVALSIDMLQLIDMGARYPYQLSGGQQQRVALARALVMNPAVLLLDEPLSNLDRKLREEMQIEIRAIQQRIGITAVYVTHDQEEALTLSDRIAIMSEGKILQIGSAEEIYERPANRFISGFIGMSNFIEAVVESIEGRHLVCRMQSGTVLRATLNNECKVGMPVEIAVRPEKIRLGPVTQKPEGPNTILGSIDHLVYIGNLTRYYVKGQYGENLVVQFQNTTSFAVENRLRQGDRVHMSWEAEDSRVFPV